MQRTFQYMKHVVRMICEMGITLNQAFIHGKQSCIVKRNAVCIILCREWLSLCLRATLCSISASARHFV